MSSKTASQLRTDATELFIHGVKTVHAYMATKNSLKIDGKLLIASDVHGCILNFDLTQFKRIFLIGFGKAATPMAHAAEDILQDRIHGGVVIVKKASGVSLNKTKIIEAGHPLPDSRSVEGAQQIAELTRSASEHDLVICLISGGGSALCTLPCEGITLSELQQLTLQLMRCGATITEMNTVRKHVSRIKGGQLARLAYPATLISLIISDVIRDRLDVIASGPTVPDPTTFQDAQSVLEKYHLLDAIPVSTREHIKLGVRGEIQETPKEGAQEFEKTRNLIIAHNLTALHAIAKEATHRGYNVFILSSMIEGNTRHVAQTFADTIKDLTARSSSRKPICIVSGGEMTVSVHGQGQGGRNTDFCLALAPLIHGIGNVVILSAGTDGIDGTTGAAGAIVDGATSSQAANKGLDIERSLGENDSYTLLKKLDRLLVTGPTETNVMDIQIVIIG
jgi:glycerate 2-kinase